MAWHHPHWTQQNLEFVINLLLDNDFPLNIIFNKINLRLKKLFNTKLKSNNTFEPGNDESVEHIEKKYVSVPYIKNVVAKVVVSALSKNNYIVGYRCLNNLGRFIKIQKDKNTLMEQQCYM